MFALQALVGFFVHSIVLAAPAARVAPAQDTIRRLDYAGLAREFLAEHGLDDWLAGGPTDRTFQQLIDGPAYARVELGGLALHVPVKSLADPEVADDFRATAAAAVEVQRAWLAWREPSRAAEREADWKALAKWVKSWSRGRLSHADGGATLYVSLGASEAVIAAGERLHLALRPDEATIEALGPLGRIVLAPKRRDFLQTMAVAGWVNEPARATFWSDRLLDHTIDWIGWTEVVCMQFTKLPVDPARPFDGVEMDADDDTGLTQYMAERAAALLLRRAFWRQDAHFFEQALANNLVIAAAGRNNLRAGEWKLETFTSGSSSQPYERFVPGGNPAGGTLPPNPAPPGASSGNATEISLYRTSQGSDHFLAPLREGQTLGAKLVAKDKKRRLSDDKAAHFAVHSFSKRTDYAVTAPFLGQLAEEQPLPPLEFLDDYEDFFRAYRSGFLHWLERHGAGAEAESRAKFAELIAAHGDSAQRRLVDAAVEDVYGVPISARDGSVDSLEWRYLGWLKKK